MDSGGTCMHASSCFIETINNLPIILHLRWHRVHTLRSLIARWITFARTPTSFFVTTDYILLTAVRTAALVSYVVHDIAYYFFMYRIYQDSIFCFCSTIYIVRNEM